MRHHGMCATPGCSNRGVHVHHIVYRSRCGGEERTNKVSLCAFHHQRCIHGGRMTVEGRAGEILRWRIPGGDPERWVTVSDDDVYRENAMPPPGEAGSSGAARARAGPAEAGG